MAHLGWAGALIVAAVVAASLVLSPGAAQAAPTWSAAQLIYEGAGYTTDPVLVSDSSGDVHLFFSEGEGKPNDAAATGAIMYTRLHDGLWSRPTDVLVSPAGGLADAPAAAVDSEGYLHVLWRNGAFGDIYYSRAHVSVAESAKSWSTPIKISESGSSQGNFVDTSASIAVAGDVLHVVYADLKGVIFYKQSTDGGKSWSTPITLSMVTTRAGADAPQIAADLTGHVYVTWSEFQTPVSWPPTGTYFAASRDGGRTWSGAVRVATQNRSLLTLATDGGQQVMRAWSSIVQIGEHTWQSSSDGGESWSAPQLVAPKVKGGLAGWTAMKFDSAGVLHMAIAANAPADGIYALDWDGTSWSQPVRVSEGATGKKSIEIPALVISKGNRVNIAFEDDFKRIWVTSQVADAPSIPARAVPTPPVAPPATASVPKAVPVSDLPGLVVRPTPTPRASPVEGQSAEGAVAVPTSSEPLLPLLAALFSAVLLCIVVVVVRARRLE